MKKKILQVSAMLAVFAGSVGVGAVVAHAASMIEADTALGWGYKQASASTVADASATIGARCDLVVDGVKYQGVYTRTYNSYIDVYYPYAALSGTHTYYSSGYHEVDGHGATSVSPKETH